VTTHSPEFIECEQAGTADQPSAPRLRRPANSDVLAAGFDYIASRLDNGKCSALQGSHSDSFNLACVLAFLGDVPLSFLGRRLRQRIEQSLDWLLQAQAPSGGWRGSSGEEEAGPTAWTILALKKNGRNVPWAALDRLWRCRARDGGFAKRAGETHSTLVETAVAVQALGSIDVDAERFLYAHLQSGAADQAHHLEASAAILDCDKSAVPFPLLNLACQVTADVHAATARDRALLLRCLLRLRLTRAWILAEELRAMQLADGSWQGSGGNDVIATAAALAALALFEAQPGLYFGSDLPRPRRLHARS
jgi:hypothetical protein